MANTINTRLILRNDQLTAWQQSQKVLLKGEAALAEHTISGNTKFDIRIGDGVHTWSELSSTNIIIPASAISGTIAAENMPGMVIYQLSANDSNTQVALVSASSDSPNTFAQVGDTLVDFDALSNAFANFNSGAAGQTLTSLSYDTANHKVVPTYADIAISTSQINGFDQDVSAIANSYTQTLSGLLSDAWTIGGLSAAGKNGADSKIALYSDIQDIVSNGVKFGGTLTADTDLTADENIVAKPGYVYIVTGTSKEYIVTAVDNSTGRPTAYQELGDEGTIASLTANMISGATANGATVAKNADHTLSLGAFAIKNSIVSGDLSDALSDKVGLSTAAEVSGAISGAISTSLNLGALAHKDKVTNDDLSGWFILSCGAANDNGPQPADL